MELLIRTSGTQTTAKDASSEAADAALAQQIAGIPGVRQVSRLSLSKETADKALSCVYYIVLLLILFSGALELIVIYNLTSINLAERSREIATVEVLGFYPKETDSYVLRENLILSLIASFIGLPLGGQLYPCRPDHQPVCLHGQSPDEKAHPRNPYGRISQGRGIISH